jgi:predicted kinase
LIPPGICSSHDSHCGEFQCLPVAIVLDLPERVAHDRNKTRPDRDFGPHVICQLSQQSHRSLCGLAGTRKRSTTRGCRQRRA